MSDPPSHRTSIALPPFLYQQVKKSLELGTATTFNQLVCSALDDYVERKLVERWDETLYAEFEAGFLRWNPSTRTLSSRKFQRDLNELSREISELRRIIYLVFRHLRGKPVGLGCLQYFSKRELEPPHYYLAMFKLRRSKSGRLIQILYRQQRQQLIACRLGYNIMQHSND